MIDWVKSRSTSYVGSRMRDFQTVQSRIGEAGSKVDAAQLILRNDCLDADLIMKSGKTVPLEKKLCYKRNAATAVRLAIEALDSLNEMAGANGIYDIAPLQRMFRDGHSAAAHIHFSFDMQMAQWGFVTLGGCLNSATL